MGIIIRMLLFQENAGNVVLKRNSHGAIQPESSFLVVLIVNLLNSVYYDHLRF